MQRSSDSKATANDASQPDKTFADIGAREADPSGRHRLPVNINGHAPWSMLAGEDGPAIDTKHIATPLASFDLQMGCSVGLYEKALRRMGARTIVRPGAYRQPMYPWAQMPKFERPLQSAHAGKGDAIGSIDVVTLGPIGESACGFTIDLHFDADHGRDRAEGPTPDWQEIHRLHVVRRGVEMERQHRLGDGALSQLDRPNQGTLVRCVVCHDNAYLVPSWVGVGQIEPPVEPVIALGETKNRHDVRSWQATGE